MTEAALQQRHHLDRRAIDLAAEGAAAGAADELLSTTDVAEWLGISTQWLEIGRGKNYGPPFVVLSTKRIRYRRADVLAWLDQRTFVHTSQYRNASADKPGRTRPVVKSFAKTQEPEAQEPEAGEVEPQPEVPPLPVRMHRQS